MNSNSRNSPRPGLEKATTFPLIVYFVHGYGINTQMSFCPNVKFLWLWGPMTLCANLWLRWSLKQSYNLHWKLSNSMSHTICTQGNCGDSQLLVVESQIANLTLILLLAIICPSGSCEPVIDRYVLIVFQWYKERLNPMGFDLYNCLLKI